MSGLTIKHFKKNYDFEFKKHVVNYYLNNMECSNDTAAKFKINLSQFSQWVKLFKEHSIRGLKPSPKGIPCKMNLKKRKQKRSNKDSLLLIEKKKYEKKFLT